MRRIFTVTLALVLAAALSGPARAAASAEIIRAFVYDGTLYTYVTIDGAEKPITKAEAKIGTQTFSASGRLETVRQAGSPVTWLLLVDNSNSMPDFRQEVDAFAGSLAQSAGENTRFIVATFGDTFSIVGEDVPAGELSEQIGRIPFDERVTRLHTAIGQALDYFEGLARERNELRCMVLLSDAVQYDPDGGVPYEELLERVSHSGVMFHSIGLGDDQEALDSLGRLASASGGLHQVIGTLTAEEAGAVLAENGDGWFVTGFDLTRYASSGGMERVSVTFAAGGELVCRAETEVELPEMEGTPDRQESPEIHEGPAREPAGGAAESPAPSGDGPASEGKRIPVPAVAAVIAFLAAAVLVILLLSRKKKDKRPAVQPGPQERCMGVYMLIEILQGELSSGQTRMELELGGELVIGSAADCDIVLRDAAAAQRHARLFISDGAVYLEDLHTPGGTTASGVELQEPRRLYSGDTITAGGTVLQVKF